MTSCKNSIGSCCLQEKRTVVSYFNNIMSSFLWIKYLCRELVSYFFQFHVFHFVAGQMYQLPQEKHCCLRMLQVLSHISSPQMSLALQNQGSFLQIQQWHKPDADCIFYSILCLLNFKNIALPVPLTSKTWHLASCFAHPASRLWIRSVWRHLPRESRWRCSPPHQPGGAGNVQEMSGRWNCQGSK